MARIEFPGEALRSMERFEILRSLGEGGHGVVYEAMDKQRRQVVALKLLRDASAEGIYRFKQEFRALSNIHHRNLARLDELFSEGSDWFFTMELVDGVTFLRYARPEPAPGTAHVGTPAAHFDEARLRSALRQLFDGVQALHRAGKLHRDLKPANVLVTHAGRVVILDFGVSAELSELQHSMSMRVAGTPSYMAPEQAEGGRPSEASDWYAVGVMLFEALTGQNPFEGSLLESLLRKRTGIKPPSLVAPGVPADLDSLCWDLLAPKAAERPSGSEILERLGGDASRRLAAPARLRRALVGRDAELGTLDAAFQLQLQGRPVVVRVHGESGVGKSALTAQFVEQFAADERVLVLSGRCYERESMPYKALDGLVDVLSQRLRRLSFEEARELVPPEMSALSRLFPVLGRVDAFASAPRDPYAGAQDALLLRRKAWGAFAELLRRLSQRGPILLVLDDLQWGDADSVELLSPLLQAEGATPVLLVASYRRREAAGSAFLQLLEQLQAAGVHTIDLPVEPLRAEVSRSLAGALIGPLEPWQLEQIVSEAAGNPFLLEQFSRHAAGGRLGAGHSLHGLIELELAELLPEARDLLALVSVGGGPLEIVWLREVVAAENADEALQALRAAQLLRDTKLADREAVDTYHDRIREAVRDALDPMERKGLHARLAAIIESSAEPDAELLATQLAGAGLAARAASWACQAADQALGALAFARATRLYRWALQLAPDSSAVQLRGWAGLGESLAGESKGAAAAAALLEAARLSPEKALSFRRRAADQLLRSGQIDQGVEVMREVLSSVGFHLPTTQLGALVSFLWSRLRVRARGLGYRPRSAADVSPALLERIDACWTATVGLGLVDSIRAADFQSRQLLLALSAGEPHRVARALGSEVAYGGIAGSRVRTRIEGIARQSHELAEREGEPHPLGLSLLFSAVGGWLVGRWRECRQLCVAAERILRERCRGAAWEIASSQMFQLSSCIWMGELAEHRRLLPGFLREAREHDDLYAVTTLTLLTYSHVPSLAADDPGGAADAAAQALAAWSQRGFHLQHLWALYARVEIALYLGNPVAARQELERHWKLIEGSQILRVQTIRTLLQQLRGRVALAAAAQHPDALGAAQRVARRIRGEGLEWTSGMGDLLFAGLAAARRGPEEAAQLLERAEQQLRTAEMGLFAAAARRRRGELTGGENGRELVTSADAWMQTQGVVRPERLAALLVPLAVEPGS